MRARASGLAGIEIAVLSGVPAYWWGALIGGGWEASPAEIVVAGGLGGAWWLLIAGRLAARLARLWLPPPRPPKPAVGDSDEAHVDV